jgi:hypothetical protein
LVVEEDFGCVDGEEGGETVFVVGEELNAHHLDSGFVDEDVDVD